MNTDHMEGRLGAAMYKLASLKRRAAGPEPQKLAIETLEVLEMVIEEFQLCHTQLRSRNEELAQVRKDYEDLFEHAPDAYVITVPEAEIVRVNQMASALLNVSSRFLVGKSFSLFLPGHRDELSRRLMALGTGEPVEDWLVQVRPRERGPFKAALTAVPTQNGNGQARSIRWVLRPLGMNPASQPDAGPVRRAAPSTHTPDAN